MPYCQRFAIIPKELFRRKFVVEMSGKMQVEDYNNWLQTLCGGRTLSLICMPQPAAGLRFRLVNPKMFLQLAKKPGVTCLLSNGVNILVGDAENGPPHVKRFPVVSQWLMDRHALHEERISYKLSELVGQVYGPGFGSRSCTQQKGTNQYFGSRGSDQSSETVVEGPGLAREGQYFRKYYCCPPWRAYIEKRIKDFMTQV
jgi:hypothetical protein